MPKSISKPARRSENLCSDLYILGDLLKKARENAEDKPADLFRSPAFKEIREVAKDLTRESYLGKNKLQWIETLIVAFMWHELLDDEKVHHTPLGIVKFIFGRKPNRDHLLAHFVNLLNRQVLYSSSKIAMPFIGTTTVRSNPFSYNRQMLLTEVASFDSNFLSFLLNEPNPAEEKLDKPYESNDEFLDDWFTYVSALNELGTWDFASRRLGQAMEEVVATDLLRAIKWRGRIKQRQDITNEVFPLNDLVDEYGLDETDTTILMYLVKADMEELYLDQEAVLKAISHTHREMYRNRAHLAWDSVLVKNGLIEVTDQAVYRSHGADIQVMPDITRRIVMHQPIDDEERLQQILRTDDIFTALKPRHSIKDLIIKPDLKQTLETAIKKYQHNVDQTLQDWNLFDGIAPAVNSSQKVVEPGLLILLYGPSGTGKTLAASTIAQSLGKQLLITDMSRIKNKWVGESERNVRRIFTTFERIVRRVSNPPVLLLNEADQFLGHRLKTTSSSTDIMHNALQNLFLEAFERLRGVMIATTNMRDNLDSAFSRRFHLKLEIPVPEVAERAQLWRLHLPDTIPGANQIDIEILASRYPITGGQIAMIVRNAATEAAAREGSQQVLTQADLEKYCEIELKSSRYGPQVSIGFN